MAKPKRYASGYHDIGFDTHIGKDLEGCDSIPEKKFFDLCAKGDLHLTKQLPFHGYKLDFAYMRDGVRIAIEIDGKKGHSSPSERDKDYKRERFILLKGWTVIRFTASEVKNQCPKCVYDLKQLIELKANQIPPTN
jgi:very-short-patch-repair endonuclease